MTVPHPRTPRCLSHHIHMASCVDCREQRRAKRAAALQRLERARQEAGAL